MKTEILGYKIETDFPEININSESKIIINTLNPHSYIISKKDFIFKNALNHSTFILPDGIGIVIGEKILNNRKIKKIAGADIHEYLVKKANLENLSIFYLGSKTSTLMKIEEKIKNDFKNIKYRTYSPPFKQLFSTQENIEIINAINHFKPDILFVGMTAPKQEKWVYENQSKIDAKIICSIGAVFDFYAETIKRPNKFWIKLGLEWLIRLIKEPKRMFTRNFISTPIFLKDLFLAKFSSFFK